MTSSETNKYIVKLARREDCEEVMRLIRVSINTGVFREQNITGCPENKEFN